MDNCLRIAVADNLYYQFAKDVERGGFIPPDVTILLAAKEDNRYYFFLNGNAKEVYALHEDERRRSEGLIEYNPVDPKILQDFFWQYGNPIIPKYTMAMDYGREGWQLRDFHAIEEIEEFLSSGQCHVPFRLFKKLPFKLTDNE